jgi:hypothetical protein
MMAQQSKLDVSKWQASRRAWQYTPVLWFYDRMVEVALLDAMSQAGLQVTDNALLARDWIARSELAPPKPPRKYVSFPECCQMLGLNAEAERMALLEMIDRQADCDNDEAWARLEVLSASEPADDIEPLFDAPRCVPALDQMTMFGGMG